MLDRVYRHAAGAVFQRTHGPVYIGAFGPHYEGVTQDWSFRHLGKPGDEKKPSSLTRHLPAIARQIGIREILVPSPVKSNTLIVTKDDLHTKFPLGEGDGWPMTVWRGAEADGVILRPGQTAGISLGGCGYITVLHEPSSQLGVAHGSRESLIDEARLLGKPARRYESVTVSLIEAMGVSMERAHEVKAAIYFPIPAKRFEHRWDHPKFGGRNENRSRFLYESYGEAAVPGWSDAELRQEGRIDLGELPFAQFARMGVPEDSIEIVKAPEYNWADTRGPSKDLKNLVLVSYG